MDIQCILKSVQDSKCLGISERQIKLLEYLLTATNDGDTNHLKEFTIALNVFNRDESFDSSSDSIVRVEMYRLRQNLKLYNNLNTDFQIIIPRASYKVIVSNKNLKFTFSMPLAATIIASLLLILSFYLYFPNFNFFSSTPSIFNLSPTVSIQIHSNSDKKHTTQYVDIKRRLIEKITPFTYLTIIKSPNAKYIVDIKINPQSAPSHALQAQLINIDKTVIWPKTYILNDINDLVEQEKLINQIHQALFTFKDIIFKKWGHETSLTAPQLSMVRCYLDLQTYFTYNSTTWHKNKIDLLTCIDIDNINSNQEKSMY